LGCCGFSPTTPDHHHQQISDEGSLRPRRHREFWNLAHRWVGLATAAFLIVAGFTGSLLAFNHELDELLNPDLLLVERRGAPLLGIDELARKAEAAIPNAVATGMALGTAGDHAATVTVEARVDRSSAASYTLDVDEVFLDPYDGTFLGGRMYGAFRLDAPHVMPFLYGFHYSLHLPGKWGLWLMGGVAILWLVDNFVGAYLTFPKRAPGGIEAAFVGRRRAWIERWRSAWLIKLNGSGYRFTFDLHRAGGLWLWFVLGVLALSSIYLNLANEIFNPIVSQFSKVTPYPSRVAAQQQVTTPISFSAAVDAAKSQLPAAARDLQPYFMVYNSERGIYRVAFRASAAHGGWFGVRFENIFLDGATGAVRARWGTESGTTGDYFNALMYPIHSGQILALPGRILICIAGLMTAMLAVTGIVIWLKKRTARSARRAQRETSLFLGRRRVLCEGGELRDG
jgi:uncharacterized iron-regulated membrane protein